MPTSILNPNGTCEQCAKMNELGEGISWKGNEKAHTWPELSRFRMGVGCGCRCSAGANTEQAVLMLSFMQRARRVDEGRCHARKAPNDTFVGSRSTAALAIG